MSQGHELELEIEGRSFRVQVQRIEGDRASVLVDGTPVEVQIHDRSAAAAKPAAPQPAPAPSPMAAAAAPTPKPAGGAGAPGDALRAMMPGVVTRLLVESGQQVAAGDVLLVLEAMKMENEIRSDRDATIGTIHVKAGQKVATGDAMIDFA